VIRKSDRRVVGLHSVGLTNKPAIKGMAPIANSLSVQDLFGRFRDLISNKEETMDPRQVLLDLLGLGSDATDEQITSAVDAAKSKLSAASANKAPLLKIVADETGVSLDGEDEAVANSLRSAFNRLKNPVGKVDTTELTKLQGEVAGLRKTLSDRECDELIAANSNKLSPAQTEWFRNTFRQDPEFARKWISEAPELVANKASGSSTTKAPTGSDRASRITAARNRFRSDSDLSWGGRTEQEYVNGELLANSLKVLSDDEVGKYAIVA
jgi:phage I-like protein